MPDLQAAELWNGPASGDQVIGWFDADGSFTRVRYRDLNTEELGSVMRACSNCIPNWSSRAANGSSAMAAVGQ